MAKKKEVTVEVAPEAANAEQLSVSIEITDHLTRKQTINIPCADENQAHSVFAIALHAANKVKQDARSHQ